MICGHAYQKKRRKMTFSFTLSLSGFIEANVIHL